MIKLKQLYDLGKDLNDFSKFPKYIRHQRLGLYYKNEESSNIEWLPERRTWELSLSVITEMGKEKWMISYDLLRWGSVEQRLPNTPENFYDGGGIIGDSPSECIRGMKKWLQDEGFQMSVEN